MGLKMRWMVTKLHKDSARFMELVDGTFALNPISTNINSAMENLALAVRENNLVLIASYLGNMARVGIVLYSPYLFEEKYLQNYIKELHIRKGQDYGVTKDPLSNLKRCEKFGIPAWMGGIIRVSDKYERYTNLTESGKLPANEAIEDTIVDLISYCILTIILLEHKYGKNFV